MTNREFLNNLNEAMENAKFFAMANYHISLYVHKECNEISFSIFYEDEDDEVFIKDFSTMEATFRQSRGTKWAELK